MNAKEMVLDRLQRLPDDVTLEDIREEIDVLLAIQEGLADIESGRVHTFEQVVEMSKTWITKPSGLTVP